MAKIAGGIPSLLRALDGIIEVIDDEVKVLDESAFQGEATDTLVYNAVFAQGGVRAAARWLIWSTAQAVGFYPASIHDLYMAAGRGEFGHATTPAINVRGMSYDFARTIIRTGQAKQTNNYIFELARSEMGYTHQNCQEFATVVTAASIREGHVGPIFLQGDHYQANAGRYKADPEKEIEGLRQLIREAIAAGYGNIDIDTSTLVTLEPEKLVDQQHHNFTRTAELAGLVRQLEPEGMTISIGGEIGEVGKYNSTVEELKTYLDGFNEHFNGGRGLSKVSVQSGTSHGGVVLPDGSIAQVKIDFETLRRLGDVAREYGLGGAVQHGASTLPNEAFHEFPKVDTLEVHLATGFQNLTLDGGHFPADLKDEVRRWCIENLAAERSEKDSEEQFVYKARKKMWGPFKQQVWNLPKENAQAIGQDLQNQFEFPDDKDAHYLAPPILS